MTTINELQAIAEANFPVVESQGGITLPLLDVTGQSHSLKFRYWINNTSRMYLIEGTQELQKQFKVQVGDVLMFAKDAKCKFHVCGRKGTQDDTFRKPHGKRSVSGPAKVSKRAAVEGPSATAITAGQGGSAAGGGGGGSKPKPSAVVTPKSKRNASKTVLREPQGAFTYWTGTSLPAQVDGIFRAMQEEKGEGLATSSNVNKVTTQLGFYTAIVTLGGEKFQAFYDSKEAALAGPEYLPVNLNIE